MTESGIDTTRGPRKPRWTNGTFLLYTGGLTVLVVAVSSLGYLSSRYGDAAFVGWSALILAVLEAIAFRFRGARRWIVAGVFALAGVVAFGVFFGALEKWWGWLPHHRAGVFSGFNVPVLLLEALIVLDALLALALFRFPLLVLPVAAVGWFFVTDLVSGGGDWSAVVTFFVGLWFLVVGLALDRTRMRPYGFWLHVAAGLTIGGSLLFFWHTTDANWALIAVSALVFVALGAGIGRSSWAVLAAVGFFLAGAHFAAEWSNNGFGFVSEDPVAQHDWVPLLVFAFVGFLLVALGLLHERRRREAEPS